MGDGFLGSVRDTDGQEHQQHARKAGDQTYGAKTAHGELKICKREKNILSVIIRFRIR